VVRPALVEPERELRVLIVDDEPLGRELLRHLLASEDVRIVGESPDGISAVEAIRSLAPDLVFLDIEMPGLDGFDVVEAVGPEAMPPVVFVTAHEQHALRAFQVHAFDYVLKPIAAARFAESFRVTRARLRSRDAGATRIAMSRALRLMLAEHGRERFRERFLVRRGERLLVVEAADVELLESAGNYVQLHCGERSFLFRATIGGLESELDPTRFLRIHRGAILRVDAAASLVNEGDGELTVVLKNGRRAAVQRRYAAMLRRALGG